MRIEATVNGAPFGVDASATASLLEVLRDAGLTGTKEGCRVGVCGVCTVMVDGLPVSACLYLAACAQGADVWTVEGVAARQPDLIDTFVGCEAMQCGICSPGQVVTIASMEPGTRDEATIRGYLGGNLCRCTGYATIVEAAETYLGR